MVTTIELIGFCNVLNLKRKTTLSLDIESLMLDLLTYPLNAVHEDKHLIRSRRIFVLGGILEPSSPFTVWFY